MKERPVIFSGPMVQAVLNGVKSQTRRVITPQPEQHADGWHVATRPRSGYSHESTMRDILPVYCPYGKPGDLLWTKEALRRYGSQWICYDVDTAPTTDPREWTWKRDYLSARFMPRWASRLTLEITDVRVERVQDISELDCEAELGAVPHSLGNEAYPQFRALWDEINKKRGYGWTENNWVWVISFRRVQP